MIKIKNILIALLIISTMIFSTSCGDDNADIKADDEVKIEDIDDEKVVDDETVDDAIAGEEISLMYMDPNIDMFLNVDAPGWRYQKDNASGTAYFIPIDYDGRSMFAISANTQREGVVADDELDAFIDYMWDLSLQNLNTSFSSFEWEQKANIEVGAYSATRFHFIGTSKDVYQEIEGDYFFWWTDKKLYICSLTALPEKYDDYFNMLESSLKSFKTYEELED